MEPELTELEKYQIALFMVIRNSIVMPTGLKLGKNMKEINRMSYDTMMELFNNTIDFNASRKMFEQGKKEYLK